jgi:hypothetical protein
VPADPAWKWGYGWFLSYAYQPENGETIEIDDVDFRVYGPNHGTTSFGTTILYWEFVNEDRILFYDDGAGLKQYINPGEAILRYHAGSSRLLIYSNLLRRFYEDGEAMDLTVQYIDNISSATSLLGSPPFEPDVSQASETVPNPANERYQLRISD